MNVTPDHITKLEANEIFTYGANLRWAHGAGAAKQALTFGAIYGQGPFRGQTYGICTKDELIKTMCLEDIKTEVNVFTSFAVARPELSFLVTAIGTGLAGLRAKDIAPMFAEAARLPNVSLPANFWEVLNG